MIFEKYPLFIKASDIYRSTFKLAEGYTLETKISKFVAKEESNRYIYNLKIVRNNILVTHSFRTTDFDVYSEIWDDLYTTVGLKPFTEELAETLGFIKEEIK